MRKKLFIFQIIVLLVIDVCLFYSFLYKRSFRLSNQQQHTVVRKGTNWVVYSMKQDRKDQMTYYTLYLKEIDDFGNELKERYQPFVYETNDMKYKKVACGDTIKNLPFGSYDPNNQDVIVKCKSKVHIQYPASVELYAFAFADVPEGSDEFKYCVNRFAAEYKKMPSVDTCLVEANNRVLVLWNTKVTKEVRMDNKKKVSKALKNNGINLGSYVYWPIDFLNFIGDRVCVEALPKDWYWLTK